jgi:hypothetical protein
VGIGGQHVRPSLLEQLARRRAGRPLASEAAGGELHEHAPLDQRADHPGALLNARAALGMGERDAEAAAGEGQHVGLEPLGQRPVRRLDQQVGAVAAERGQRQLLVGQPGRRLEVDLGARQHLERQAARPQVLGQLARAAGQLARTHARMVRAQVRRGDQRARAGVGRDLGDGDAPGQRRGPVVDPRQHVRVQVDHALDLGARP